MSTFADRALREDLEGDIRDTVVNAMRACEDGGGSGGSVCVCAATISGEEMVVGLGGAVPWRSGGV